ncbi:MAG: four helix bundle protein [Opitutus sp.]
MEFGVWSLELPTVLPCFGYVCCVLGFESCGRFTTLDPVATIERFEDLECWKRGRKLKQLLYRYTRMRNFSWDHALVNQVRRAAQSVTANISEGFEREGNREFIQFLSQSKGSVGELKDHLYTALDEHYITQTEFDAAYRLAEDATNLLGGLMSYLRRAGNLGSKFKRPPT